MKRILFLCTLVLSFYSYAEKIEHKGNHEVNMNESPLEGVKFSFIETNGFKMRIAEMGEGPLVLLAHGWPESWFSLAASISRFISSRFPCCCTGYEGLR
ncbi:MAG: hypothetical protein Ct9H300mP20_06440 [Gammaproteobacteria bacterium]|nr:MAG: hypothetical protein Ct9H300mP20_06440 [Gammaproteobacteria bacterium]